MPPRAKLYGFGYPGGPDRRPGLVGAATGETALPEMRRGEFIDVPEAIGHQPIQRVSQSYRGQH